MTLLTRLVLILTLLPAALLIAQQAQHNEVEVIGPSETDPRELGKADVEQVAQLIVEQTNRFRKDQGFTAVERESFLDKTAHKFADYMATEDRYGHTADGNQPAERAKQAGYEYCIVLENIAYQYSTDDFATKDLAERFVTGWKESPGHRRNMLDEAITQTGVAVSQSKQSGYYYAVQMFGRPKSAAIMFSLMNRTEQVITYQLAERKFELEPDFRRTHTVCRTPEVTFTDLADAAGNKTIKPTNGQQFEITTDEQGATSIQPAQK